MKSTKNTRFKWLYIMLTALLVFPMFSGMGTAATNQKPYISAKDTSSGSIKSKINSKLKKQFDKQEKVTFLIKFKEQVDTKKVAKTAGKNAISQKASPAKEKYMKRSAVVSSLRSTSIETQGNVNEYLKKQEKAGKAKNTQSFYIVNAMAVTATKEVMEQIAAFPEVEKILPNETRQLHKAVKPADSKETSETKASENSKTDSVEWNLKNVGAPSVWKMGIDGTGTVVASIDTGVQWDHPALKEKYRGFDPANPNNPDHEFNWYDPATGATNPYDEIGHGTHVTGTMVGAEPNGDNQIGVAPGAKWIAVKAFTEDGGTDVDLLAAGEWILAPKDKNGNPHPEKAPDVVNNSWGGGPGLDEWYRPMVNAWRAAEIFPEFSVGNTNFFNPGGPESAASPSNYPESFATGAVDINNKLGEFSLQGPSPYDEVKPDISAPGVNIRSSVPGSDYEGGWNGTSMAGPHVSGVVAMLRQVDSSLTVDEIEEILLSTSEPLTDSNFPNTPNNGYGYGLVNAYEAVASITSGLGKIKGQVSVEGEDKEKPKFEHSAPQKTYSGIDLPLDIQVTDNVSVTNVELQYLNADGNWSMVQASRTIGDHKNGSYAATIPGTAISAPTVTYKWKITDYIGNEVISESYEVSVKSGVGIGYLENFEANPDGWISYGVNNAWEWGIPTSGPKKAVSGDKVYATKLDGKYPDKANMTLLMPPIDLKDGSAYLQFKQWYELEQHLDKGYDFGHVFVSTDMENWTQKLRISGKSNSWIDGEVDLSEYAGQRIYVAFNVTSDFLFNYQGWYLDDVRLSNQPIQASNKSALGVVKDQNQKDSKTMPDKEKVDPSKITPVKEELSKVNLEQESSPSLLPLGAEVSVLESGRSTFTNQENGSYKLNHATGTFTVQAEAYGHRSASQSVAIPANGEVTANFVLEEIPKGTISGVVTNEVTGEPVSNATLLLMEDAAVQPVQTNKNGQYSITAYEGSYTLKVTSPSFYSKDYTITVNEGSVEQNVQLKPFIGYPGEIGYDDGTAENAHAFNGAGNGWAVKMSLAKGETSAMVTGGLFRFWDTAWPEPGGTDFQVAVYDASGVDGGPGKKLAGPFNATALRNGEWTHVDLSTKGIMVNGDFYMVYIQSADSPYAPGLANDEDGENFGRSWMLFGGKFTPTPEEEGNYMIRATVNYEVKAPVITSPADGFFTNRGSVIVEGNSAPTTTVKIYKNGEESTSVSTTENGTFSAELQLNEGENTITAKASTESGTTDTSAPVKVVYDKTKPNLSIDKPVNNLKTNKEAVTVEGTVSDQNLDWVKVNGQKAKINAGKYSHRVLLSEGENTITVIAKDKAGNSLKKSVVVDAKFTAPSVENLQPAKDQILKSGESVKIEFDSEAGLKAVFAIRMPLTNAINATNNLANTTELPMMETSPGHYVGYYTATSNVKAPGAEVEIKVTDAYGNETRKTAAGKLFINAKK
ncbi:peptidase S8 [Sporosarcina globispora]|uniref:Peptidase S8 n=1 Tax=Sporosarcina globispora TaxID=1459 RepID=A0A0M0GDY2_SPOGL|nr:peptidase S8 [Sporosarcina globispora]